MRRFPGASHGPFPRVAVIVNDAIGNFAAASPLLQKVRSDWGVSHLLYVGGRRTIEFQDASTLIDESICLFSAPIDEAFRNLAARSGQFDVVVNLEASDAARTAAAVLAGPTGMVCGPCIGPHGRGELAPPAGVTGELLVDRDWTAGDLTDRYPILTTGFIGEIFVRLCGIEGPVPNAVLPRTSFVGPVPDVIFSAAASLTSKLWPASKWIELASGLRADGLSIGIMGAPPSSQSAFYEGGDAEKELIEAGLAEDCRGRWTLPQCVDVLSQAKLAVSIDNGIGHMAAAAGVPAVLLFRDRIFRLWAPPVSTATIVHPMPGQLPSTLSVSDVMQAALRRLQASRPG